MGQDGSRLKELRKTLRRVLENLREGRDPAAVRTDEACPPSQAYRDRRVAVEQTERYIDSLAAQIPAALADTLRLSIVHLQRPLLAHRALAEHVASHRQAVTAAMHRGGLVPADEDTRHLARLAELQHLLETLASERRHGP